MGKTSKRRRRLEKIGPILPDLMAEVCVPTDTRGLRLWLAQNALWAAREAGQRAMAMNAAQDLINQCAAYDGLAAGYRTMLAKLEEVNGPLD